MLMIYFTLSLVPFPRITKWIWIKKNYSKNSLTLNWFIFGLGLNSNQTSLALEYEMPRVGKVSSLDLHNKCVHNTKKILS